MTIESLLAEHTRARPNTMALIDGSRGGEKGITFARFDEEVAGASAWLLSLGLRRGNAVLVLVPMSASLYVLLLAMFRLGIVALFPDPSSGRGHIERCCERWFPDALLASPKAHLLRFISGTVRRIPLKIVVDGRFAGARHGPAASLRKEAPVPALDDPALVTFTSGSTGEPKAAVRTHRFLLAQFRALAPAIALTPGEVDLATLPIFALANLAGGVTTVISSGSSGWPGKFDGARLFARIERTGVTRITASPAFFERLVAYGTANRRILQNVTRIHTGGGPVFPRLLDGLRQIAPHARVVAVYGSTEAEPVSHLVAEEIPDHDLSAMASGRGLLAGRPVGGVQLRILQDRWGVPLGEITGDEFAGQTMASGEPGEIVVAGEHVLKGYLGGVGDEETKFRVDGEVWHRTGDAGFMDDKGRLWLLGRCAERMRDPRGTLYPLAVESAAMSHPGVRRAAALIHRQRRMLVVEAPENEELDRHLRALGEWARIDRTCRVSRIPVDRRHHTKIDYPRLRELLDRESMH